MADGSICLFGKRRGWVFTKEAIPRNIRVWKGLFEYVAQDLNRQTLNRLAEVIEGRQTRAYFPELS